MITNVKVLLKPNDSPGNKDLIHYLRTNLPMLLANDVLFSYRFISDDEIPGLIKKGIDKLPAIFIGERLIMDSINIKASLNKFIAGPAKKVSKSNKILENPEDAMKDMYMDEMTPDAAEKDANNNDDDDNFMAQVQKEIARRQQENEKNPYTPKKKQPDQNNNQHNQNTQNVRPQKRPQNVGYQSSQPQSAGLNIVPKDKDDAMLMGMFEETL
jgi:hypothetical protein